MRERADGDRGGAGGSPGSSLRLLHVPHAFASPGNTLVRVASYLSACHAADGGTSAAVVSDQRSARVEGAENLLVDYSRYCPRQWFSLTERRADAALGLLGARRRFQGRLFVPAVEAAAAWEPDVVLLYEGHALASIPYWRRALPRSRLVVYVHNAVSRSFYPRELARLLDRSDGMVCVSGFMRQALLPRLPHHAEMVRVVHNGVDTSFFTPAPEPGTSRQDGLHVLFAGQVAPHKGPDLLVRAVAAASRLTAVPIHLRVVGSRAYDPSDPLSPYEVSLRGLAMDGHIEVDFRPFVARGELRELYRATDVVCVPSVADDPFPLVVLEAMACGAAVIASRAGGIPEAGGDVAVYVNPADTAAFARALAELAEDPNRVRQLGLAGVARAEEKPWSSAYRQVMDPLR